MSAIKDIADLIVQLDASIADARTRELFLPLKEKFAEAKLEHFESERQHREEIERLKSGHSQAMDKLKTEHQSEMSRLQTENLAVVNDLQSKIPKHIQHSGPSVTNFLGQRFPPSKGP